LTEIERTEAEETSLELEVNLDLSDFNHVLTIDDSNLDELTNEAEESVIEVEAYDRNITIDEVITYTDPVGNTFEVPAVPPCAAHDLEPTDEEKLIIEKELYKIKDDITSDLELDDFEINMSDDEEEEADFSAFF
jgi:hypothetical protein